MHPRQESLRRCYERGDFESLRTWYAPEALFDGHAFGRRVRVRGPDAIVAQLSGWWPHPGELLRWQVDEFPSGWVVELERTSDGGPRRQREFIQLADDRIVRQQVYSARPQSTLAAPPPSLVLERLLRGFGAVVAREPLVHSGQAGAWIERVTFDDGRAAVVKRVPPERDFQGRITGGFGREAQLWEAGVVSRLPPEADAAILAAAEDDGESLLVMRDVSDSLVGVAGRLTRDQSRHFLTALAAIHRAFAGERHEPLIPLESYLRMTSPANLEPVLPGEDYIPKVMAVGWEVFADAGPPDVTEAVLELHRNPGPLATQLERCGTGVAHGDYRCANLGLEGERVIVLDWGLATQAPGVIDLGWYVFVNGWRIDASKEELIADYRAAARDLYDEQAIRLGMLAAFCWFGGLLAHELIESDAAKRDRARRELDWWCARVREAVALL